MPPFRGGCQTTPLSEGVIDVTFRPTYGYVDEREPITADHYNQLITDLITWSNNIDGTELAAPLLLSRTWQNLNMYQHYIYNFARIFGTGLSGCCVRDVTGFGATGDGSTVDSAAIQSAIDDCPTSGGIVFIPPGTYVIDRTILLCGSNADKERVSLMGSGPATKLSLKSSSNCEMIRLGATGPRKQWMMVHGIRFFGNPVGNTTPNAILNMDGTIGAKVKMCQFHQSSGNGIYIGDAPNGSIVESSFYENENGYSIYNDSAAALSFAILSNRLKDSKGIFLEPAARGTLIARNQIYTSYQTPGITVASSAIANAEDFSIVGNEVCESSESSTDSGDSDGIVVRCSHGKMYVRSFVISANVSLCNEGSGIHIYSESGGEIVAFSLSNNVCHLNWYHGIHVGRSVSRGAINGNTCNGNGASGIYVSGDTDAEVAELIAITANSCGNTPGETSQNYGIRLTSSVRRCTVVANVLHDNTDRDLWDASKESNLGHNAEYP